MELTSENLKTILGQSHDMVFTEIYINGNSQITATLLFVDGLIDKYVINNDILKPLEQESKLSKIRRTKDIIELINHGVVYHHPQKIRNNVDDVINDVLTGSTALIFDEEKTALTFDAKGYEKRSITEPTNESVIKGAKDSFVEDLRTNTATVRNKIRTKNLVIQETIIGKQTLTPVALVYLDGITNMELLNEVKQRLDKIDIDGVTSVGFIEEYIIERKYSSFPQVISTERPDKFCANILEGRVGIIIGGYPVSYIIPATLAQFFQTPEDYAQNYTNGSIIRVLRYILLLFTLLLPAAYIVLVQFNQGMIPSELAFSIAATEEGVPFPSFIQVIFMVLAFEALQEAGIRLPRTIGQIVPVVGALIVGDAAVKANMISPIVVIVIAATVVANYTMPNDDFRLALRIWRFLIIILSSILGLLGLSLGIIFLLHYLCKIETFGVPYLSPFAGIYKEELKDTLIRFPLSWYKNRPSTLKVTNPRRQK
ncbi:MAG: spore germination protein [Syntrophomonadaceae bacterium]|nr:spore germination protein [Syntrophomonadaceae bacterium]